MSSSSNQKVSYSAALEIRRLQKDGNIDERSPSVYFKRDGQRFESEYTLKMLIDTHYEFRVNIRPPLQLHSVSVQGTAVTVVDHHGSPGKGQLGSTISFKWDTINTEPDKKRKRSTFQGNLTLIIPLQVKYYRLEDEDHLTWGTELHHIDYECEHRSGMTCIDVLKTFFR